MKRLGALALLASSSVELLRFSVRAVGGGLGPLFCSGSSLSLNLRVNGRKLYRH